MDLNQIQLTGRLDREPLLYDIGDHHVAALHLVCERRWRKANSAVERAQDAFRLTAWEELADECGRLLHVGDQLYVVGQLRLYSTWVGGIEHTAHEVLLDQVILLASGLPEPERPCRPVFISQPKRLTPLVFRTPTASAPFDSLQKEYAS
jgi:hypothetical protein